MKNKLKLFAFLFLIIFLIGNVLPIASAGIYDASSMIFGYRLDEGSGTPTIHDITGIYNSTSALSGTFAWVNRLSTNASNFGLRNDLSSNSNTYGWNNTYSFGDTFEASGLGNNFTISFWWNTTTDSGLPEVIAPVNWLFTTGMNCHDGGNYYGKGIIGQGFNLSLYDCANSVNRLWNICTGTGNGKWHYCTIVKNGSTIRTYSDGEQTYSVENTLDTESATGQPSFFRYTYSGTSYHNWNGSIDDFIVYNYALDLSEILLLNETTPPLPSFNPNITNCTDLQNIQNNLTENYNLTNNIDCSDTINWNDGAGFIPIGNSPDNFAGTLNGQGYNVTNLFINKSGDNAGLFYLIDGGTVKNIGLINANITGNSNVGGLAGYIVIGNIENSFVTGSVYGAGIEAVGGLAGVIDDGNVNNSYFSGDVYGALNYVGGLAGVSNANIENSFTIGTVYADGEGCEVGGLVGDNFGTITNSYSLSNVSADCKVGGLAGYSAGTITNSYSAGLIQNRSVYSIANEIGSLAGGLVGLDDGGTYTSSYWNMYLSGQNTSAGGTELTNAEMILQTSYVDWDFDNIWDIQTNSTPYLRFNPLPFFPNFPLEEAEAIQVSIISYENPITLNGGTTKDIFIVFNTSSSSVNESSAKVIITNGAESRTSSSCTNISNDFNCTITMQFYDSAGTWTINASIKDNTEATVENSSESFTVNALDYVTQDVTYVKWATLTLNTNDNEADNTIILTNGGNQDYATTNIKAYDIKGDIYSDIIDANKFSIDNLTGQTSGQIYLQNNTNIDVTSKINLNSHSASSTAQIYFYIDVPFGLKGDNYNQINSWEISFL